jgi:hypothetical protein
LISFLVRTIIELVTNESYYESTFSRFIGLVEDSIRSICKNETFSELYEISALCSVLRCNIRSVYPKIHFREEMAIMNNVFTPISPIVANCGITVLWCCAQSEMDALVDYNNLSSPNHFVPLMLSAVHDESDHRNVSISIAVVTNIFIDTNSRYL